MPQDTNPYAVPLQSDSQTFGESSSLRSNSSEKCVICNGTPAYRDGPNIYPTCGRACSSKLLSACSVPDANERPTSLADTPNMSSAPNISDKDRVSRRRTSEPTRTYPDKSIEICVICKLAPVYRDGTDIYSTCGMACASILQAACDLPNTNKPRTSDPPNTISLAPNKDRESPRRTSEPTRTYPDRSIEKCVICNGTPAYRDGSNIYPTCGRGCSSKLQSARSVPDTNEPPTTDAPNMSSASSSRRSSELIRNSSAMSIGICVICKGAPVYRDGPNIHLTCGMACASKLRATSVLPNINEPSTSNPLNMTSAPNRDWEPLGRRPEPTRTYAERSIGMCVFCNDAPMYRDGTSVYSTCGMACASNLLAAYGLPNTNKLSTSDPSNSAFTSPGPSWINMTRSISLPNQIGMCDVCHVRLRCQRGGKIYPTCGLSCAAKLHGSAEMCDYCEKRPKVVIDGKTYPHCGKTCRDKAKFAETECILCRKSAKAGESDFCSASCKSLADTKAPFLIEIPRGHVSFEKAVEVFTSEWQTSETQCPTIKRVYMVVMKESFVKSFEKYSTKLGSRNFLFQRKKCTPSLRWLVFSSECNFGDPENLEPCCSNKCLLCSIVRSSFNRSDFPGGITTSGLNRTVDLSRADSSSKIAALMHVVVGREAEMSPRDVHVVSPLPPPNTDSVHVIGVRSDGSRLDLGIIVYDGDAVRPIYLISYE